MPFSSKVFHAPNFALQMSLRTFTENVINLAVESCLVCDLPEILTPKKVDRMAEENLRDLAAESEAIQCEREMLQSQVKMLRDGLRKCQQAKPRESTRKGRLSEDYNPNADLGNLVLPAGLSPQATQASENIPTLSTNGGRGLFGTPKPSTSPGARSRRGLQNSPSFQLGAVKPPAAPSFADSSSSTASKARYLYSATPVSHAGRPTSNANRGSPATPSTNPSGKSESKKRGYRN